jgi:glycerol kinase
VQYYPQPSWVEHDAKQIYETLLQATDKALKSVGASADEIKCIGIDNQGETVVAWDKNTG